MNSTQKSDAILRKALQGALAEHRVLITGAELKNLTDAFTARLDDAGVDMSAVDELIAEGEIELIDPEDD